MLREFLEIALGNLWRLKLRSILTVSGVMIGIGAMVSMLSFGNGMQRNVSGEFRKMGLLRTMHVFPRPLPPGSDGYEGEPGHEQQPHGAPDPEQPPEQRSATDPGDSTSTAALAPPLDESAVERIAALDGVALVYPQESFDARIRWGTREQAVKVQALPTAFTEQRPFGEVHGRLFASDSAREAVISRQWLARNRIDPDSILGDSIRVQTTGSSEILLGLARRELQRLGLPPKVTRAATQLGAAVLPVVLGSSAIEMKVVGTTDVRSNFGFSMAPLLIPIGTSSRIDHLSFSDPYQLLSMLSGDAGNGWRMLVVTVDDEGRYAKVRSAIEAMGFHVFSFVDQFEQIRRSFLIFDALVGAIGFLALFIASLSIVNTMLMSITERTREIGVLKSLGAQEGQIHTLFLFESGAIGLFGSVAGVLLGYAVSRIGAVIVRRIMLAQGGPDVDPFSLSVWIALGSVAFGVGLSLLAGLYPATRAARVDPVEALRQE